MSYYKVAKISYKSLFSCTLGKTQKKQEDKKKEDCEIMFSWWRMNQSLNKNRIFKQK